MSISLNIVVAIAFLVSISFTHKALLDGLQFEDNALKQMPLNSVETSKKNQVEEEKEYLLPSVFLFDKNS